MQNKVRKAVLDMGSNTFKFKIFEGDHLIFFHTYPVQIGTGLAQNSLTNEMLRKISNCFEEVQQVLEEKQAVMSRIIGTSALRDAKNSEDVVAKINHFFGLKLEIIPGKEEAEFIYKGVRKGINSDKPYLICDIGGGSVELIYCTNSEIIRAHSFEVGVIKLYKMRTCQDPYSQDDIGFYIDCLEKECGSFLKNMDAHYLVGAAGSFESLFTLAKDRDYTFQFEDLTMNELKDVLNFILKSTQKQRDENQRIPFERKILLPLGAILVKYLINKLEINKFTVSPNSLIEGLDL